MNTARTAIRSILINRKGEKKVRDSASFIRQKRTHLPMKYMRRSLKSIVKRPVRVSDVERLNQIDEFYKEFIDLPYN